MPDSAGDKTERATPRRREEARDSGQVARSNDLTFAVLLVAGLLTMSWTSKMIIGSLANAMRALLGNEFLGDTNQMLETCARVTGPVLLRTVAPILLVVMFAAFLACAMQVGFHPTLQPLMPNLAKLNPLQGFGRLFGGQNVMQLVMNLAKMALVGAISWERISSDLPTIVGLSGMGFPENFSVACGIVYSLTFRIAIALLILSLADWIYQRWKFERDIRMTKQEIKDEAKRMEGDMEAKGRRRQLARKMIVQRMHRDVPKADVVVTNPTELAIALRYDPDAMGAPRVVAKGAGFLAARIRQIALANGVPLVERKPLAQALYKTVEVGGEVPPEFYQTVAEILAYVYELSGKGSRRLRKAG